MKRVAVGLLMLAFAATVAAPLLTAQSPYTTSRMPYAAFDALPKSEIAVKGGVLHVAFAPGRFALEQSRLLAWIETSARAVSTYYGAFPVKEARILIVPAPGRGVTGGQAFGYRGAAVRLIVGEDSTDADLKRDWKAVHEMIHLALPDVDEKHLWLSEGLAVYIESIARVQAGDLPENRIWGEFARDMPQGQAKAGEGGLDDTPTWGRRYWGGATFCLLADVEMRQRTGNAKGLQDAMRGVLAAGGNFERHWPVARILAAADDAVGVPVLTELYAKMRADPAPADLDALWALLGVGASGERTTLDDTAPGAPIRRAITRAPAQ